MPTPTPEQATFIREYAAGTSARLDAVAGSGKTTTLVQALNEAKPRPGTLCLAFNKSIANTMKARVPGHVDVATLNGLGHRAWAKYLSGRKLDLQPQKVSRLVSDLCKAEDLREAYPDLIALVSKARSAGLIPDASRKRPGAAPLVSETAEAWETISDDAEVEYSPVLSALASKILSDSISLAFDGQIDFDDQIYMSVCFSAPYPKYTSILVDEAQDLNGMNHRQLARALALRGQLCAIGDPHQAIYGFRGALANSMDRLSEAHSLSTLPLTVCFRCPQSVISEAQRWVPHIRWAEGAAPGKVSHAEGLPFDSSRFLPGDHILCRNNAPMLRLAFRLFRRRVRVEVFGRDIAVGLTKLIEKIHPKRHWNDPVLDLIPEIEAWRNEEMAKARARHDEARASRADDRAESILAAIDFSGAKTIAQLAQAIADLFAEKHGSVSLSTIHKAKGLEFPRVFILDRPLIRTTPKDPSREAEAQQERNLLYVAITRAQQELTYISSEMWEAESEAA